MLTHDDVLTEIAILSAEYNRLLPFSGMEKWFQPGAYYIDKCPKHEAFFAAGADYKERLFMAANRAGKALSLSAIVHTPSGPTTMGELSVGDYVVGSDGNPTEITGYYPQGLRPTYLLTASDGSSVECDAEHLWAVRDTRKRFDAGYEVLTTTQLLSSDRHYALPPRPCINYSETDLPVDPYLLGVLIGDGGLSQRAVILTTADQELVDYCTAIAPAYNCVFTKRGNMAYQFASPKNNFHGQNYNLLRDLLDGLGLTSTSHTKRIPEEYKTASFEQRLALLQGLMDTDGFCGKNGQAVFYSVSKRLVEDVADLLRGMGCNAAVNTKRGKYKGEEHISWQVNVRRSSRFNPFRLTRKAERYTGTTISERGLMISSIEYVGEKECACITVDADDSLFLAGQHLVTHNSVAGAYETACHATGLYPDWWKGRRFTKATLIWACGTTGKTTRDTVQKELLGPLGSIGQGMLPANTILETYAKPGVPNGIDTVLVKHVSGGTSVINFLSYDQGIKGFQGTAQDVIWLDEECPDDIYGECMIRTMTTKGLIYDTFTPQHGMTPFIINFHRTADLLAGAQSITAEEATERMIDGKRRYRAVVQAGWDDAPWLEEDEKARMLDKVDPHLRDARSKGIPSIGDGNVYPISWEEVSCDSFEIPAHWRRIYGLDVGWNFTAAIFAAINPETDTAYIYAEYKQERKRPEEHAIRLKELSKGWIPGVIDPASRGRSQIDGGQLLSIYRQHGLRLQVADNAVDSGINRVWDRLSSGKLKFFRNLYRLREEYMLYHRKEGRIVKENDHELDALRYAMMEINRAKAQHSGTVPGYGGEGSGKSYFN